MAPVYDSRTVIIVDDTFGAGWQRVSHRFVKSGAVTAQYTAHAGHGCGHHHVTVVVFVPERFDQDVG